MHMCKPPKVCSVQSAHTSTHTNTLAYNALCRCSKCLKCAECLHTHTHIHTHIYRCPHTHTHTHTHTLTHTHARTHAPTHPRTHACTHSSSSFPRFSFGKPQLQAFSSKALARRCAWGLYKLVRDFGFTVRLGKMIQGCNF